MAKNWWVNLLKNLFTCESKTGTKKIKSKKWRCVFGKFWFKQLPTTLQQKLLNDAQEEHRKHALNVAKATAAAADAAVAAAQAAVEVVRLTNVSRSCLLQRPRGVQNLAAIKIQTAFRAYLARKALRALKGVVRIQAIARGKAVRRRVSKELEHSQPQSVTIHPSKPVPADKLHSRMHSGCYEIGDKRHSRRTNSDLLDRTKLECKSQRQWTGSLFSKEEIESIYLRRQDSALRMERMKQFSFSLRERQSSQMPEDTLPFRQNERHTCLRKNWTDNNVCSKGYTALNIHSDTRIGADLSMNLRIKPRNLFKEDFSPEEVSSASSCGRRSFCHMRIKPSLNDEIKLTSSSFFPTYMAATESAKAKMRSMSTPRQRIEYLDSCLEYGSPCKTNMLHWKIGNPHQYKSLSVENFNQ